MQRNVLAVVVIAAIAIAAIAFAAGKGKLPLAGNNSSAPELSAPDRQVISGLNGTSTKPEEYAAPDDRRVGGGKGGY